MCWRSGYKFFLDMARYRAENDQMCFLCFMSFCVFFFIAILFNRFVFYVFLCFFLSNLPRLFVRFVVTLCWREKKTQKHITTCCVFVFFCLKSSWLFLPCVFCVFVFFFFKFLSWYFCTFLFCHVLVLPDQKFCRFFLAFFRFISCLLSANIFFLVNFNLFF